MFSAVRQQMLITRQSYRPVVSQLHIRALHQTSIRFNLSKEDIKDKDRINAEPNEYSKSGSDAASAHKDGAFDPSKTTPEESDTSKGSSLNASPANTKLGMPTDQKDDSPSSPSENKASSGSRERTSGSGSPAKGANGPTGGQ